MLSSWIEVHLLTKARAPPFAALLHLQQQGSGERVWSHRCSHASGCGVASVLGPGLASTIQLYPL